MCESALWVRFLCECELWVNMSYVWGDRHTCRRPDRQTDTSIPWLSLVKEPDRVKEE